MEAGIELADVLGRNDDGRDGENAKEIRLLQRRHEDRDNESDLFSSNNHPTLLSPSRSDNIKNSDGEEDKAEKDPAGGGDNGGKGDENVDEKGPVNSEPGGDEKKEDTLLGHSSEHAKAAFLKMVEEVVSKHEEENCFPLSEVLLKQLTSFNSLVSLLVAALFFIAAAYVHLHD